MHLVFECHRSLNWGILKWLVRSMKIAICFLSVTMVLVSASAAMVGEEHLLKSPDGRIHVSIRLPKPASAETPQWSATFLGNRIVTNCSLGLQIAREGDLMKGARLRRERKRSVNNIIPVLFGKSASANDRFNEISFE